MTTTVVRVTKANRHELLTDPRFVWVGRACGRFGVKASIWGNPFKPTPNSLFWIGKEPVWNDETRAIATRQAVAHFRACLETAIGEPWDTMRSRLPELRGKRLGCWCGSWSPGQPDIGCHAVVLARRANALSDPLAESVRLIDADVE